MIVKERNKMTMYEIETQKVHKLLHRSRKGSRKVGMVSNLNRETPHSRDFTSTSNGKSCFPIIYIACMKN